MLPGNQVLESFEFQQFKAFGQIFFRTRGRSWGSTGKRRRANATWSRLRFSTAKSLEGWDVAIFMTSLNLFFKDFEDFDIANEDDVLEEFLGLERSKPKVPQLKWEKGGFNLCKEIWKYENLYYSRSHRSKREQLLQRWTSWTLASSISRRRQSQAKKKMRYLMWLSFWTSVFLLCISSYLSLFFFHLFSFPYFVFSSISLFLMKKGQAESPRR